jgi:hypothetical protein
MNVSAGLIIPTTRAALVGTFILPVCVIAQEV